MGEAETGCEQSLASGRERERKDSRVQLLLVHKLVIGIGSLSCARRTALDIVLQFFRNTVQEARPFRRRTEIGDIVGVWCRGVCRGEKQTGVWDCMDVQ
jgi:hypothetical protein